MYIKKFTLKTLYLFIGLSVLFNYNIIVFSADTYKWSTTPDSLETSTSTSEPITPNNALNLQSGAAILIDQTLVRYYMNITATSNFVQQVLLKLCLFY